MWTAIYTDAGFLHVTPLVHTKLIHTQPTGLEPLPSQVFLIRHVRKGLNELNGRLLHLFPINVINLGTLARLLKVRSIELRIDCYLNICYLSGFDSFTCFLIP